MKDFRTAGTDTQRKLGISISSGGAHGVAFLGMLKGLNAQGLLQDTAAFGGASAGAVISSIVGSVVNRGLLVDRHADMQGLIDEGIEETYGLFQKAAFNGSLVNLMAPQATSKFLAPYFQMMAKMSGQPDAVNQWNMQQLPHYLDPEAVERGPIDVYIALTQHGQQRKQDASLVVSNDVRPSIIAASCAINEAIRFSDGDYWDGGYTKAAPTRKLIDDSGCNHLLMIGETHPGQAFQLPRDQTQALIAENSEHATPHFEGHAQRLRREYREHKDVTITYAGVPLPNCDHSRADISHSSFERLFELGVETSYTVGETLRALHDATLQGGIKYDALTR